MFFSFEGIDGSGKTTQMRRLAESVAGWGKDPLVVREPGGTELGEKIRTLLLATSAEEPTPRAELMLFQAARAQLTEKKIVPALETGRPVIADRFFDSTTAYQGAGRVLSSGGAEMENLSMLATGGVVPDRTYLIDVPVETAVRRRRAKTEGEYGDRDDRIEKMKSSFYRRVRGGYKELARRSPRRVMVLDGTESVEQIAGRIAEDAQRLIEKSREKRAEIHQSGGKTLGEASKEGGGVSLGG